METNWNYTHGGDIYNDTGVKKDGMLDFSSNINPLGMQPEVLIAAKQHLFESVHYPDPHCRRLRQAIADYEHIPLNTVLCAGGASDILFRLAYTLSPKKVLVTAPCFSEYERCALAAGAVLIRHVLTADNQFQITGSFVQQILTEKPDLVFLCNPNNPTGQLTSPALILEVLTACQMVGAFLVVDECFLDFVTEAEYYSAKKYISDYRNLLILKAFTKFFAMPGLRLGYALCANIHLLNQLQFHGPDWSVSTIAQTAGIAALTHLEPYRSKSIAYLKQEQIYLCHELSALAVELYSPSANYIFLYAPGQNLFCRLNAEGILIRDCANYAGLTSGYYRIAIRSHEDNMQLIHVWKGLSL